MGTPEFAVASLQKIIQHGYQVVAVITAPDKPQGRGQKLAFSPVKEEAIKNGIPVLQPTNLKDPAFVEELKSYQANLQVVVAFRMLPEVVWSMPQYGTFNLHASILPQYRGAAPINWAIINGETETGVTTFFIRHEIDTGNIILQEKEPISSDDDAGSLYERLMFKGADLVLKTVEVIEADDYVLKTQKETLKLKPAPKIFKEDCRIDWSRDTKKVYNFVRGLSPYPTAWSIWNNLIYKIYRVSPSSVNIEGTPGTFRSDDKNFLMVKTGNGAVNVEELQVQGKKRMTIDEFLRGNKL